MLWADLSPNDDPEERIREGHLEAYRALIALRNGSPALRRGAIKTLVADDAKNLWVFERTLGDERVVVALNGSSEAQPMPDVGVRGETLFVSDGGGAQAGTIPARGVWVLRVR
jgi:glycosidase